MLTGVVLTKEGWGLKGGGLSDEVDGQVKV